jgi:sugar phosphate isomerase/epimerase
MSIRPCIFSDEVAPDFDEAARRCAEAGAEGLELRGRLFGKSITEIDADDVMLIQDVCRRHRLEVAVIGSPVGKCSPDDAGEMRRHQEHFQRMVELAELFGTRLIRGFSLWRPGHSRETDAHRPDLEAFLPRIVDFLEPIVTLATQSSVRFCLETEGATLVGTCAEARRVMDALGSPPALGLAWDVNNGLSCGEQPQAEGYPLVRGRVYHLHVKPNAGESLATVGDADLTYEQVLETLRDDGYSGWASIEHWGSPEAMLHGLRELAPLLERINRAEERAPNLGLR